MNPRNWRLTARVGFTAAAIVLLVAVISGIIAMSVTAPAPTEPSDPRIDLTVNPSDILPDQARCQTDEFITNSLASTSLRWSDSVSTPFVATTLDEMVQEIFDENCGNPTVLVMNVEALAAIVIDEEGTTIGDLNPWMGEFLSTAKVDGEISFNLLTKKEDSGDAIFVTSDFQETAALTNTLLLRLKAVEVSDTTSLTNWHVDARSGLAAGTLPVASLNTEQYKGEFLQLEYTLKGQNCALFAVGFNTGDKRFATLPLVCEPEPVPESTPGPEPTPPPTTEPPCPPEVCVTPKSSNPGDYVVPDGKPKVEVTDPPEETPTPVETEQPGGNGVVDTPSKDPGSESGVTAPDKEPAPTKPSTPPSNEGGTNVDGDGWDNGGF